MNEESFNYTFYKIFKNGCECYIGSTKDLKVRIRKHKYNCNTEFYKNGNKNKMYNLKVYQYIRNNGGFDAFDVEVLETKYCSKVEAEIYEGELMKIHNSTLNVCRNYCEDDKKEFQKEFQKEYHKTDKYKEYQKQYKKTDKRKEYRKQYYQKKKLEKQNIIINITNNIQNLNITTKSI